MFYANGQKGKAEAKTNWPHPTVVEVTKLVREVSYLYTDSITYLLTNCLNPDMNIGTLSAGKYAGQLALLSQTIFMSDNHTYYYKDPEVYCDPFGWWCLTEEAINVNGTLYAPSNILTDVYGGVHARGTDTYQYCFSCGKVFPVNDPHFTEGCNEN